MPTYRYEEVIETMAALIRDGTYRPGDKLPTRRELRQRFEVSDIVITYAMRVLRQRGLVESLPGVGVYVANPLPPASA